MPFSASESCLLSGFNDFFQCSDWDVLAWNYDDTVGSALDVVVQLSKPVEGLGTTNGLEVLG